MFENTLTALKIAESALKKGHRVNLIASGDGVYCFLKNQKAKGIINAEEKFSELIQHYNDNRKTFKDVIPNSFQNLYRQIY